MPKSALELFEELERFGCVHHECPECGEECEAEVNSQHDNTYGSSLIITHYPYE